MPLTPLSLVTLVGILVPHLWVIVVNFCSSNIGLSHLSSGAGALSLFSSNVYALQNSLRIPQSFWCLYLPIHTVFKLKWKLKYIMIQSMCFEQDSKSSGNYSRNWQSGLHWIKRLLHRKRNNRVKKQRMQSKKILATYSSQEIEIHKT